MLLGVDVGGTFTDAVLATGDTLHTGKAPSTPRDQSEGVMAAVGAVLERAGGDPGDIERFAHGMTVATNALLEGNAARTVLIATEGFTDLIELGRQARAHLYRLCADRPAPLTPADRRVPAPERCGPDGPLRALDGEAARATVKRAAELEPEAVAVVLLHAYRHPEHEQALGEALGEHLPDAHVSLSHDVVGTFREYERAATTEVDAALGPLLARYLRGLVDRAGNAGLPEPQIMQSNGGLADLDLAARHPALTVLSGPAGGAAGGAYVAEAAGEPDALGFDMGGTSCDVCVIDSGRVREAAGLEIGGRPLALPMLDVHTVGAGGGSIGWRDAGGALRVGPRSAGADPGPACYGRGGTEPTVTDANLLLGYLDETAELAGGVALDRGAAARAVGALAGDLGLSDRECAQGIIRVANNEMARALRVMTVERGVDPRRYALVPFGGAGPMHAAAVAEELGIERILCPRASGVLAALGLVVGDRRRDAQRSVLRSGDAFTAEAVRDDVEALAARARDALGEPDAPLRVVYELRYRGQAFELAVQRDGPTPPDELTEAFAARHEERYGYRDPESLVELVTVRVTAAVPGPGVTLEAPDGVAPEPTTRSAVFRGDEHHAQVLRGELTAGLEIAGPAICELPEATLVVPPGWSGDVHATGTVRLRWTR
ncbi:MAG: hydantoinase/oxoprolinase family protein [Solirubrobacteraceae bacterium]